MSRLRFIIGGLKRGQLRSWRALEREATGLGRGSTLQPGACHGPLGRAFLWLIGTALVLEAMAPFTYGRPTVVLDGVRVVSKRLLVLTDRSTSVDEVSTKVEDYRRRLSKGGIELVDRDVYGYGIGTGTQSNPRGANRPGILQVVRQAVRAAKEDVPTFDAVYVISDFHWADPPNPAWDESNARAADELLSLLQAGRRRLYLATVRDDPPALHKQLVIRSKGRLIEAH